jgi:hypothetical protein
MKKLTKIGNFGTVSLDLEHLNELHDTLFGTKFITQVGVLGAKAQSRKQIATTKLGYHKKGREASEQTNAEIGLVHEKGSLSRGIPRRSFLLFPLQHQAKGLMGVRKFLWNNFMNGDQSLASLKKAYTLLGIAAENIIQKAFQTGGFGKWPKLSQATIDRKKSSAILIDSGQLRRSITSRVVIR